MDLPVLDLEKTFGDALAQRAVGEPEETFLFFLDVAGDEFDEFGGDLQVMGGAMG